MSESRSISVGLEAELGDLAGQIAAIAETMSAVAADEPDGSITGKLHHDGTRRIAASVNGLLDNMRASLQAQRLVCDRLEREAEDRAARMKLIVDGSNDGFWVWNLEADTIGVSERWCAMSGLAAVASEDSPPGLWLDRVHADDRSDLRAAIRVHLQGLSSHVEAEYRMLHADGSYRWMLCRGLCRRDHDGRPLILAGTQTDVTARRHIDAITGQPNERYFRDRLIDTIDAGDVASVAVIGLDRRADLTESLSPGQISGLLRRVFAKLSEHLPVAASLALLPGDTFGVILQSTAPESASVLLAEVLEKVFAQSFPTGSGERLWLTASAGIANTVTAESSDPDAILSAAWAALRRARGDGSTRGVAVYHPDQRRQAERLIAIEMMLRERLLQGRVHPFFQPIVLLSTGRLHGFEALVRIIGPNGDIIPPDTFIPVAERTGLVSGIGDAMLRASIAALSRWRTAGVVGPTVTMSVNLAVAQLSGHGLPEQIGALLAEFDVPPSCLKVEVTETVLVHDDDTAVLTLKRLRDMGVRVAMDDFGTGYSSLSHLRRLPVDTLKIDRSFISGIDHLPGKRVIAETICSLGRVLGMDIVAEGVETVEEERVVIELGVQLGQGYRYGRPVPADDVEAAVRALPVLDTPAQTAVLTEEQA